MEDWEIDFQFLRVKHFVKDKLSLKELPDMKAILFLIGIQELGMGPKEFTKEEKRDLMHIAVCSLLEEDGFYEFIGRDEDGWPHWNTAIPFTAKGVKEQEAILHNKIISYFKLDKEEINLN